VAGSWPAVHRCAAAMWPLRMPNDDARLWAGCQEHATAAPAHPLLSRYASLRFTAGLCCSTSRETGALSNARAARWRTTSVASTIHTLKQALSEPSKAKPYFMTGSVSAFWLPRGNRPLPSPTACSCLLTDVPHRTPSFETLLATVAPSASTEIVLLMRFCIRRSPNVDLKTPMAVGALLLRLDLKRPSLDHT